MSSKNSGGDGGRQQTILDTVDPRLLSITPAQLLHSVPTKSSSVNAEESLVVKGLLYQDSTLLSRRSHRRKRTGTKKQGKKALSSPLSNNRNDQHAAGAADTTNSYGSKGLRDPAAYPKAGNAPDIYWRAIPIEHLRKHPQFRALPNPNDLATIVDLEDVRMFRQDSWQWDALHDGRCTTSQAIAALGFLQPQAAEILSVPSWWQKRCAYSRLRQNPLRTLADMNRVLCQSHPPSPHVLLPEQGVDHDKVAFPVNISSEPLWRIPSSSASNFTMDYTYELSASEREVRRRGAFKFSKNLDLGRFMSRWWGDIHEATAVLVAINCFGKHDNGFVLEETGMCGAGHLANQTATAVSNNGSSGGLLIGATPDGILRHSDGRVEVLEVKNHCPFLAPYANKQRITKKSRRALNKLYGSRPPSFDDSKGMVFPCYVPQLQLEMFCVGQECRSAVMVRLTARAGALIVRMQRDDEWIAEMLYWLNRFQTDFVIPGTPPGDNFFWANPNDRRRYEDFLCSTKAKSVRDVEFVARVPFEEVQRMGRDCPLFLD